MQANEPTPAESPYAQPLPAAKRPKLKAESPGQAADWSVRHLPDLVNYPRKRTAMACDVCRVRKSRCDSGRPSCASCAHLGVACSYRGGYRSVQPPLVVAFLAPPQHLDRKKWPCELLPWPNSKANSNVSKFSSALPLSCTGANPQKTRAGCSRRLAKQTRQSPGANRGSSRSEARLSGADSGYANASYACILPSPCRHRKSSSDPVLGPRVVGL
jgi:hypothetical protein